MKWKAVAVIVASSALSVVVVGYRMRQLGLPSNLAAASLPQQFLAIAQDGDGRHRLVALAEFSRTIKERETLGDVRAQVVGEYQRMEPAVEILGPEDVGTQDFRISPTAMSDVAASVNACFGDAEDRVYVKFLDEDTRADRQLIHLRFARAEAWYDYVYEGYDGRITALRYGDLTRGEGMRSLLDGFVTFALGCTLCIGVLARRHPMRSRA